MTTSRETEEIRYQYLHNKLAEKYHLQGIPVRGHDAFQWVLLDKDDAYGVFKPLGWLTLMTDVYKSGDGMPPDVTGGVVFDYCPQRVLSVTRHLSDEDFTRFVDFIFYSSDLGLLNDGRTLEDIEDRMLEALPYEFFLFKTIRRQEGRNRVERSNG